MVPCEPALQLADLAVVAVCRRPVSRFQSLLDSVQGRDVALVMGVVMPVRGLGVHDGRQELLRFFVRIGTRIEFPFVGHERYLL